MGLTAKRSPEYWLLNRRLLQALLLILSLALLVLLYVRFLKPGLNQAGAYSEQDLPAIKVVVKNGCGIEKLASDYRAYLKDKNIDVVNMLDTPYPIYNKSLIEVKRHDPQDLARLQKMTGIRRSTLAEDEGYEAPFVIIVGADYEEIMK